MRYHKPPLSHEQQAEQLISQGFLADKGELVEKLKAVSYYRLSGYWYPWNDYSVHIERQLADARNKMNEYLKELGLC